MIPWVDGSDPKWLQQKDAYHDDELAASALNSAKCYRDWGLLRYWFRAAERYAPWVRRIHFITCGQLPEWLNLNHPKLHFVRHEDYIPRKWLPTFSSHPIELNMFRIDGLSEKFVYFNDDVFLNAPVKPEDFFVNDLPRYFIALGAGPTGIDDIYDPKFGHINLNIIQVIIKHFDFRKQFRENWRKWFYPKYGAKFLIKTLLLLPFMKFTGFTEDHSAFPHLKSAFAEVWDKEHELLETVSSHKFRQASDVNQWLMKYWLIASGKFYPRSRKFSHTYAAYGFNVPALVKDIKAHTHKVICINDSQIYDNIADFDEQVEVIRRAYAEEFPEKSAFEL